LRRATGAARAGAAIVSGATPVELRRVDVPLVSAAKTPGAERDVRRTYSEMRHQ
jgi:hypothetical protein